MQAPSEDIGAGKGVRQSIWREDNRPRIRSITGIRIHQLTLPESLSLSYRRDLHLPGHADSPSDSVPKAASNAGPSRHRSGSFLTAQPLPQEIDNPCRQRSGSTSTFVPSSPPATLARPRTTRPRAPTLAGEALEHAHDAAEAVTQSIDVERSQEGVEGVGVEEGEESPRRILARCFVVLRLAPALNGALERGQGEEGPDVGTTAGNGMPPPKRAASGDSTAPGLSRTTSAASVKKDSKHPGLQTSASTRSLKGSGRERTTSMQSSTSLASSIGDNSTELSDGASHERILTSATSTAISSNGHRLGSRQPRLVRAPSDAAHGRRPTLSRPGSMYTRRGTTSVPSSPVVETSFAQLQVHATAASSSATHTASIGSRPFYISPIHRPSTHPRFLDLVPRDDFALWLSPVDSAASTLVVEVWYEDPDGRWSMSPDLGGRVDLEDLRKVDKGDRLADNVLEFTLVDDPRAVYYLPSVEAEEASDVEQSKGAEEAVHDKRLEIRGVMERSMRETRMKRGAGVGALHQLVNTQAVLAGTQSSINGIISTTNKLLLEDNDHRALKRDVSERRAKVDWLKQSVSLTERRIQEVQMRIDQHRAQLAVRRDLLDRAEKNTAANVEVAVERQAIVQGILDESASLETRIHQLRAHHVQTLDAVFPISPIDPSSLLYSILDVPLPIPTGPQDRTPPIMLPPRKMPDGRVIKVDEQTTAASLGYVALALQVLVGLQGSAGKGLGYPVTYAGSRSVVKDVTSVMTGPRSFPLYTKGVERYRFEYAVFLLNKNIDIDANIRLVDARHTLPNLKALLLTLSSPELPPPTGPATRKSSGASTFVKTRATSRQTSYQFSLGMTRGTSIASLHSPRPSTLHVATGPRRSIMGEKDGTIDMTDDVHVMSHKE